MFLRGIMMKKSVIVLLGLVVILGGCLNKVSYGDV